MRGHFDVSVRNAGGLKDEDFVAAKEEGRLFELLEQLEVAQRAKCDNILMHWIPPTFYHNVFQHGFADGPWPTYDACVPMNNIGLMVTDSEPVYNYAYGWYGGYHAFADNIGDSTGAKGFTAHDADGNLVDKDADGREEVFVRTRFLFLPSQGNSNNIRSVGIFGSQYTNQGTGSEDRYMSGRVRLKDPTTGLPTILLKNFNQVMVIEYTYAFVAV